MGWFKKFFTTIMLGSVAATSQPAQAQLNLAQLQESREVRSQDFLPMDKQVTLAVEKVRNLPNYKAFKKLVSLYRSSSKQSLGYYLAPEGKNSATFQEVCLSVLNDIAGIVARSQYAKLSSSEIVELDKLVNHVNKDIAILKKQNDSVASEFAKSLEKNLVEFLENVRK
jgi:hypothetical protein